MLNGVGSNNLQLVGEVCAKLLQRPQITSYLLKSHTACR
jgi:hypothetical protein